MYVNIIKTRNELNFHKTSVEWRIFKEEEEDMSMSYGQDNFDNEVINFLFKYHTLLKHQQYVNLTNTKCDSHYTNKEQKEEQGTVIDLNRRGPKT